MATHRHERVRELLKRTLGEAVRRELSVGEAGIITVNDVELSGDFRIAKVFISVLGNPEQQKTGLAMLKKSRHLIQSHVAKEVILKYIPRIMFIVDDSVERGNRILALIEDLERSTPES